ncbi:MAG: hypothetical protein JWP67_1509, partial [Mucilaginibacter sp.]|nr:hypothetical protein [Mucilaginibacter sp.]
LCILVIYSAFEHGRYEYVLGCAFIAGIIITLKIRLIKEIKNTQKP